MQVILTWSRLRGSANDKPLLVLHMRRGENRSRRHIGCANAEVEVGKVYTRERRAIPSEFGPWWMAAQTFIRWSRLGVWERMLAMAQDRPTFRVKVDMVVLSFTITDNKGHYINGLKPKDFRILGKPTKRLDTASKINGTAKFGIDAQLPGMLVAVMARAPQQEAKATAVNDAKAKAVKGVQQVITLPSGVAVLRMARSAAERHSTSLKRLFEVSIVVIPEVTARRSRLTITTWQLPCGV